MSPQAEEKASAGAHCSPVGPGTLLAAGGGSPACGPLTDAIATPVSEMRRRRFREFNKCTQSHTANERLSCDRFSSGSLLRVAFSTKLSIPIE